MRRPYPIPPAKQIRGQGRACHPPAQLATFSWDELAHMQNVAAGVPEQELSSLFGSNRGCQQAVPPWFKQGPFPRPRWLHGKNMFVPRVHEAVPPLPFEPWHETDVPGRCFECDWRSILVKLKLDRLHSPNSCIATRLPTTRVFSPLHYSPDLLRRLMPL